MLRMLQILLNSFARSFNIIKKKKLHPNMFFFISTIFDRAFIVLLFHFSSIFSISSQHSHDFFVKKTILFHSVDIALSVIWEMRIEGL